MADSCEGAERDPRVFVAEFLKMIYKIEKIFVIAYFIPYFYSPILNSLFYNIKLDSKLVL